MVEMRTQFAIERADLVTLHLQPARQSSIPTETTLAARRGLKEAWSKSASPWTRTGYEAYSDGRAGQWPRSPYPSSSLVVDPAVVRGRRSNLPREICGMSQNVTEGEAIHSDRVAEVSRGQIRSCSRQGYWGTPKPKGGANR